MASSGGGNRQGSGNRSGSGNRQGSGNRKPTSSGRAAAADRARDRLEQQQTGGRRSGSRSGGGGNRRPPAGRRPPQRGHSTARTAGIFGGAFVVLAVVIIILVSVMGGSTTAGAGHDPYIKTRPAPANIVSAVEHVPASELAAAGNGVSGDIGDVGKSGSGAPIIKLSGASLTSGGKPEIVYIGSEFCPYCAATRWPLAIALSRFGTFKGLEITASSPIDVYSDTHTLSFAKSTYTSPYLTFKETEQLTNICPAKDVVKNTERDTSVPTWESPAYACNGTETVLQKTPVASDKLLLKYDVSKYFGQNANGIPFIDFGGKYVEVSALYNPAVLHGATWDQIVDSFKAPTEGIGQYILATANRYTAMICEMLGSKAPASVCNASYVKAAEKALKS